SFAHYFSTLRDLFRKRGLQFTQELYYPALTQPLIEFFERHFGKDVVGEVLSELQMRSNEDALSVQPYREIFTTLQHLFENNKRVAVWTNRDLISAKLILNQTGLSRLIEHCISGTCLPRKPNPEALRQIARRFGVETQALTMVGDHEHDVEAAKSVGAMAVRASWHSYWEIGKCQKADLQFYKASDFYSWVQSLP
ncbi:MAG: HAD-IA family hydrolase, partial [Bdellovibrionota bacterium]